MGAAPTRHRSDRRSSFLVLIPLCLFCFNAFHLCGDSTVARYAAVGELLVDQYMIEDATRSELTYESAYFRNGAIAVHLWTTSDVCFHVSNYLVPGASLPDPWEVSTTGASKTTLWDGTPIKTEHDNTAVLLSVNNPRTIRMPNSGTVIECDRPAHRIVLQVGGDRRDAFIDTYRSVRQVLVWDMLNRGAVLLHASAVSDSAGVTLHLGAKGAGKTTAMLRALYERHARFVANDRVLVLPADVMSLAFGWPGIVRPTTHSVQLVVGIASIAGIHDRAGRTAYLLHDRKYGDLSKKEKELALLARRQPDLKIALTSSEIACLAGQSRAAYGRISAIRYLTHSGSGHARQRIGRKQL